MWRYSAFAIGLVLILQCAAALAGGPCSGVRGGCGRSTYRSSAPTSSGTTDVDGYYRADGTYVRPHTRRTAGTADYGSSTPFNQSLDSNGVEPDQSNYRDSARTTSRSAIWNGTGSERDDSEAQAEEARKTKERLAQKRIANAASILRLAKNFAKAADKVNAHKWYQRVVDEYPDTDSGKEAKTILADEELAETHLSSPEVRIWTDTTGKFTIKATFFSFDGELVTLLKLDGAMVTLPLAKLSAADEAYVRGMNSK
jgi:hypothetical protein